MKGVEEAKARARQYHFLASVYLAPLTDAALSELRRIGIANGESAETAKREFNNLFIVPTGQYTTPYEAVYRDEREVAGKKVRGLLMGTSTVDVIQRYRRAGAKMEQTIRELPDHIGVELAFMEFLCEQEARARKEEKMDEVNRARECQKSFLQDHLIRWLPLLTERIGEKSRLELYRKLAGLTIDRVRDDMDLLTFITPPDLPLS